MAMAVFFYIYVMEHIYHGTSLYCFYVLSPVSPDRPNRKMLTSEPELNGDFINECMLRLGAQETLARCAASADLKTSDSSRSKQIYLQVLKCVRLLSCVNVGTLLQM
jgi:hypothetical protein